MAIWYTTIDNQRRSQVVSDHGLVFPSLIDQVNDIAKIEMSSHRNRYSLMRAAGGQWQVSAFENYPASASTVANFLIGFAQLRRIEPKTANPEKLAALDLTGLKESGSAAVRIDLHTSHNRLVASLLIGKRQPSMRNSLLTEYYVREPDKSQTWLVDGRLNVPVSAIDWLDTQIISLKDRIQMVTIRASENTPLLIERGGLNGHEFVLTDIPDDHQIRYQYRLNDIGKLFYRLKFEDVRKVANWTTRISVTAKTADHLSVTAMFGEGAKRNFVRLIARAAAGAEPQVIKEAEQLNRQWVGWMYELPDVRREMTELTMADLVEPID